MKLFKNQVTFWPSTKIFKTPLEFQKIEDKQTLIAYIGDIIKKRRKVEMENRSIQQERMKVGFWSRLRRNNKIFGVE